MAERDPIKPLQRFTKPGLIPVDRANTIVDTVNRVLRGVPPTQQLFDTGNITLQQFRVVSVDGDFLLCHTWDGSSEGVTNITVAKPYLLRRGPFDGQTRNGVSYVYASDTTRTATLVADATTEDEVIVPSYQADDIIYACPYVVGGTSAQDDGAVAVEWLDVNVCGRAWAKVSDDDPLPVTLGGTGVSTFAVGEFVVGNGAGDLTTQDATETKTTLSLNNVENTAISTWNGTVNLTTLGTISTGVWQGTTIAVAKGGTGLTGGTSGGVLAYTAAGTLASSGALTANAVVIGGGAGAVPATLAALGNAGDVLTSAGAGAPPAFAAPAVTNHAILSATHTDSTAAAVVRGDIIAGIGVAPKWERLAKGTQYEVLTQGAEEPGWGQIDLTKNGAGESITGILPVANGGTGLSSGTSGGVLAYTAAGTLASSAALTANAVVVGGGAGAAPATLAAFGNADNVLRSAGAGAPPAFATINLAASGAVGSSVLQYNNGGTGNSSYTTGDILYASGPATLSKLPVGTQYEVLVMGASIGNWGQIDLTKNGAGESITGILPTANGGTGVNNAGTITNATATTITGGGTLALAGYTLTVPATGTAQLRGAIQAPGNANYTALATDAAIIWNITGSDGNKTLTLPAASATVTQTLSVFIIKTSGTNQGIIAGAGADQIYYRDTNAATLTVLPSNNARYQRYRTLVSMGTNVWVVMEDGITSP